jgi:hypothetical protein
MRARLLRGLLVVSACYACGRDEPPPLTAVPAPPGATRRTAEAEFQRTLLRHVLPAGSPIPALEVYETPSAFAAVVEFYERLLGEGRVQVQRFAVASRMQELARGARSGAAQQVAIGRLLFERAGSSRADSLTVPQVADSLDRLAARLADVHGTIALARVPLATTPPKTAVVSIERPHLDASRLAVDSVTVVTIAVQPRIPGRR